jgi:hypothetical protein
MKVINILYNTINAYTCTTRNIYMFSLINYLFIMYLFISVLYVCITIVIRQNIDNIIITILD